MENNYFIFTKKDIEIELERFHICSWEFKNNSALIEFGGEIKHAFEIEEEIVALKIYIPWLTPELKVQDLYNKLKESENSRFIFNDSVIGHHFLDDGRKKLGVIQMFNERNPLCIIPIEAEIDYDLKIVNININLKDLKNKDKIENTSLYFRFFLEPKISAVSTRKNGINRSTIIYDIKLNERRNIPEELDNQINSELKICPVRSCFSLNILPNSYELTFFDSTTLKNVRTLEFDSFERYLGDKRVRENEYVVVFNKKKDKESYTFFSIFSKERIGAGQFALAVLVNLICGILLFLPAYREGKDTTIFAKQFWKELPVEVYLSISLGALIFGYFAWPGIVNISQRISFKIKNKISTQ